MYTFQDYDTGETISFESVNELRLDVSTDFVTGQVTAYIVEIDGMKYRVTEEFYMKAKELKGD